MRWIAALLGIGVSAALLSSCSLPFYFQAASGQLQLLRKREPIEEVIAAPQTPATLRAQLADIDRVRAFAIDELQLPDNGSYRTYVDLERDYVVWNVVAAEEFSVTPQTWCFPFAGCVAYRGFFDREKAEGFQARLAAQGLDTYSGGSDAYSTLGYFADPVLSTMLDSGSERIAALLIHELAHQRVYVKGDSELSEAFASTVEEYGTRRWLERTGDRDALARYEDRLRSRAVFAELIAAQQGRLEAIYAQPAESERRDAKAAAFGRLREEYARARDAGRISAGYDGWFAQDLNNATLASVATYRRWVPALRARLAARGLAGFYDDVEALADSEPEARLQELQRWQAAVPGDEVGDAGTAALR